MKHDTKSQIASARVKVAVFGPTSRMGKMLIKAILDNPQTELVAALATRPHPQQGEDIGKLLFADALGVALSCDLDALNHADVAIDFTHPQALAANLDSCRAASCALMLGTTGLEPHHHQLLAQAAQSIPILQTGNTSLGIALLQSFVLKAAQSLGLDYDIEIVEAHHKHKVDAPSGTALMLGQAAAQGRSQQLEQVACMQRKGQVGARKTGEIGFSTIRGGEIIGEHNVMLIGENERLELKHSAQNRQLFAQGALHAALWLAQPERKTGLYAMSDCLAI